MTAIQERAVIAQKDEQEICLDNLDTIIIAIGVRANQDLAHALQDSGYSGETIAIGDAQKAKNGYLLYKKALQSV